jgi:hypothetical protein
LTGKDLHEVYDQARSYRYHTAKGGKLDKQRR